MVYMILLLGVSILATISYMLWIEVSQPNNLANFELMLSIQSMLTISIIVFFAMIAISLVNFLVS